MLVYRSGLLDNLPGPLVAPRCFGVHEQPGGEVWPWLEDIVGQDNTWSPERHGLAARHLGRLNGAYLASKPLPDVPWLSTGPHRLSLGLVAPSIRRLHALSDSPLFEGLKPPGGTGRILALWAQRDRLLAQLDRLPHTLCHRDARRRRADGGRLCAGG